MLHICSWLKHGCLLTSLTNQFILNISQLARLMLMLPVRCSEQWLYLDVFIAVFLHLLPSWDLMSSLVMINPNLFCSAPLCSSITEYFRFPQTLLSTVLGFYESVNVLLCHLSLPACPHFSASSLIPIRTSLLTFLALLSHFLFTLLHQKRRICRQLTGCLTDWLNEYLTGLLSSEADCITTATWPQLQTVN